MPRFVAVSLARLRVELASVGAPSRGVLGVVIARPGGAVKDETSLLGNTRLDEVSPEAFALGIQPGQTMAAARARSSELRVKVVPLGSVTRTLAGLAEMALGFGPRVAFETGGKWGDVVWVDVTGCAHLYGAPADRPPGEGESALLAALGAKIAELGYACRLAVADGPSVAAAVARFGPPSEGDGRWVAPGGNAAAIGELPLAALGLEAKAGAWLFALGIRHVRDLQKLPRKSLGLRLGSDAARVLALLSGDDPAPLVPYEPPEKLVEEWELESAVESSEALLFVVKRLTNQLAARLGGRCLKAARLELALKLESSKNGGPKGEHVLSVVLASPQDRAEELFALLRTKVEASEPAAAPILAIRLTAVQTAPARAAAIDLFAPEAKAERALPKLVNELLAELGPEAVGTLSVEDSWVLSERSTLLPYGVKRSARLGLCALLSGGVEPSRVLARPLPIRRSDLQGAKLVARFESVAWWRGGKRLFEHYTSWVEGRGMAWVELEVETESARVLGWLD